MTELEALKEWLSAQPETPKLHINGADFPTAVLTVDFGQPLDGVNLGERGAELNGLMRNAAKTLLKRRAPLRVNHDSNGVYWVSAQVA